MAMKTPARNASTKRNTFLVEIVIVILFFSISASVILQLFVVAHNKSAESRDTNMAVLKAQEITESFQGLTSFQLEQIKALPYAQDVQLGENGEVTGRVLLDENWQITEGEGRYAIELQFIEGVGQFKTVLSSSMQPSSITGSLLQSEVKVLRLNQNEEKELFVLKSNHYVP